MSYVLQEQLKCLFWITGFQRYVRIGESIMLRNAIALPSLSSENYIWPEYEDIYLCPPMKGTRNIQNGISAWNVGTIFNL